MFVLVCICLNADQVVMSGGVSLIYSFLKFLHVASVVVFLGNIAMGLFWHAYTARTGDARLLAHVLAGIIRSDKLFTMPGVVVIAITGIVTAVMGQLPLLRTGWILWTVVLFVISGLVFMLRVAPLQRQLLASAETGMQAGRFDVEAYRMLALRWER